MADISRLKQLLVNDNGFAFDPVTGLTYNISLTGLDVIQWLKQGHGDEDVVGLIADQYEVDRETAERDYNGFLAALHSYGLLETEESVEQ
jgi:hypothetical protein